MKQKYFDKKSHKQKNSQTFGSIQQSNSQIQLNQELYTRFQNFLSNQKLKKLKHAMDNYIGRNTPINYHPQYNFQQQWQNKRKVNSKSFSDFLHTHNLYIQILALFILVGYCTLVWYLSFQIVFQKQYKTQVLYFNIFGLIIVLLHAGLKFNLHFKILPNDYTILNYLKVFFLDFFLLFYFLFRISFMERQQWILSKWTIIFDIFFIINGYIRGAQIYKSFRMKVITSIYKDFFNLFDLLATSLIVAHVFALMLYLAGSSGYSGKNWIQVAQIDDQGPKTLYVYSLYFACTTMLTVGYGDLAPANMLQILTVLIIQIFGIAIFAYVINQIGHTLSSMRKQEEALQKDLSSLSKVAKYYGLDQQLANKAKAFIIDNRTSINQLLPQQEKQLLIKLNDDLRTQINQQNSLKIIKSSVFFICHWSKKMQFQIAKKLTKKLYSPNQKLLQNYGKQSIYLIKRGKVQIYTDRHSGLKRHFKKLLKTIEVCDQQGVTNNVYGYTAVVSLRPIKLNAITKDFTVVYYLQKNDFIESLMDHQLDFQYFHQIKCRIDLQKLPQAYQAPSILNIREHYRPNIFFVIKKNRKKSQTNIRMNWLRDQARPQKRRMKVQIYDCLEQLQGELDYPSKGMTSSCDQMLKSKTATDHIISYFNEQKQNKRNLHTTFDSFKEYEKYFKKFNLNNILVQLQKENYAQMSTQIKLTTIKMIKTTNSSKSKKYKSTEIG